GRFGSDHPRLSPARTSESWSASATGGEETGRWCWGDGLRKRTGNLDRLSRRDLAFPLPTVRDQQRAPVATARAKTSPATSKWERRISIIPSSPQIPMVRSGG